MTKRPVETPFATTLPEVLTPHVSARLDVAPAAIQQGSAGVLPAEIQSVFACSDFIAGVCQQDPALLDELDRQQTVSAAFATAMADCPIDESTFMRNLRQLRNREMARIAWRDLTGRADPPTTLSELSELAEACITAALQWSQQSVSQRHGVVLDEDGEEQSLLIIAMGKLGGSELNFSSDIDLVFLYPEAGESTGPRVIHSDRYFARVGQAVIKVLDQRTDDGFVYRVDTRLRPFGNSGALALSFSAFEAYLQQHGREWERYAYVKARPLTGNERHKSQFLEISRPFVYRRYLDFGVLESLREMKAMIAADVARFENRDDIKQGPGGIREIEFIAQSFQLLRGGTDVALRQTSLLPSLEILKSRDYISIATEDDLRQAYLFLRQLENRLQYWRDEQLHHLPEDTISQARIAYSMGQQDWPAFLALLDKHRSKVSQHFDTTVSGPQGKQVDVLAAIWKTDPRSSSASDELAKLGYDNPAGVQQQLQVIHDSSQYRHLDSKGRQRFDNLIPQVLRLAAIQQDADAVITRLLNIFVAVGRRSAYFALLNENPKALERLVRLCAKSPWIARRVAQQPILLDELIDPRIFEVPPTREDFAEDMAQRFSMIDEADLEREMNALRLFQQASVFRVAVSDLSGVLPLMTVSDRLTDIAELVLQKTLSLAQAEMVRRYGHPMCGDESNLRQAGFAVVGFGKLGGLELSYASDLDLVLLHDSAGTVQQCDGEKALDNPRYFARLGQRLLHILNTTTTGGVLYEVDTRLRPSGKGGPLVSSLTAFEIYQRESAWTWEHQALSRARAVAGDENVCKQFEQIRQSILTRPRDAQSLKYDVISMRKRMRKDLPGGARGQFDIKRDAGGLTDIEFLVQYWVLAHAATAPMLVRWSDNIRQLESLAKTGIVEHEICQELTETYRQYRQRVHRLALADATPVVADDEFSQHRERIIDLWSDVFEQG